MAYQYGEFVFNKMGDVIKLIPFYSDNHYKNNNWRNEKLTYFKVRENQLIFLGDTLNGKTFDIDKKTQAQYTLKKTNSKK